MTKLLVLVWLAVGFTLAGFLLWGSASCIDEPVRDLERISTLHSDIDVTTVVLQQLVPEKG
jgi:hypothetical protein